MSREISRKAAGEREDHGEGEHEHEALFRALAGNLTDYVVIYRDRGIRYANGAFAGAAGCRPDELIGASLDRFIATEDRDSLWSAIEHAEKGMPVDRFEVSFCKGNGSLRQVAVRAGRISWKGRPSALLVLSDRTGQEVLEQELKASEERYRMLGEIIPFGVWTTDPRGNFTYCSDSFTSLLGLSSEDLAGFGWIQKLPPQDRDQTLSDWKRCLETGCLWDYEYRVIDLAGKERFILSRGAPVTDDRGTILSFSGVHLDITALRSAIRRLEASLLEKEVIIKEVHHRVKNNMAVISGFISLQSVYTDDPVLVSKLEECQQRVKTMALVHEHLYQGRSLEFIDSSYYLGSLVRDLVNASLLGTKIDCQVIVDHLNISLDSAIPCGLIVNELVTNALKHAFPGRKQGTIRVEMHLGPDHRYELVVADDGVGLPPGFELPRQSTLGMQLVQVLVNQLGGELAVDGANGTRFTIGFPEKF